MKEIPTFVPQNLPSDMNLRSLKDIESRKVSVVITNGSLPLKLKWRTRNKRGEKHIHLCISKAIVESKKKETKTLTSNKRKKLRCYLLMRKAMR